MSAKQDKATTERHARTLRELLKRPENKACADCKRNDPRWASWNLGVFLCIRCSGIHRSMGTHISKVKSVDLDVWTPEQMASIQKWGNRRANLYWEAHLRAGHVPPDHKMDSYIRSKYESRRWAREGAPPEDPSVLEGDAPAPAAAAVAAPPMQAASLAQAHTSSHASRASVSSLNATRSTQPHQLLSTAVAASRSPAAAIAPPQAQQAPVQQQQQQQPQSAAVDLFSLDFHAPTSSTPQPTLQEQPKKDVTAEIMSLFSTATPAAPPQQNAFGGAGAGMFGAAPAQPQNQFGGLGGMGAAAAAANPWGALGGAGGFGQPQQQPQQPVPQQQTGMMGNAGVGMWGANSGWNAAPAAPAQQNIWSTPAPASQQSLFATSDVWSTPTSNTPATGAATQKNNDAFGDLWGGFK